MSIWAQSAPGVQQAGLGAQQDAEDYCSYL